MNERRITIGPKEISIYELIERLSRYTNQSLTIAKKPDYDCYYMTYNNYDEDLKNSVFHIGYTDFVHLEGDQFITVCTIDKGKIKNLKLQVNENTINLTKLYIDNMEGKNVIKVNNLESTSFEMPY